MTAYRTHPDVPMTPWFPRPRWTTFTGVACLVIRYAIALSKGARR